LIDHDISDIITRSLDLYYDTVVRCAYMRLGNIHDAEDAAQDVFVAFMTAKKRPRSDEHIKAWLIRAAINRSIDMLRAKKHRDSLPLNEELDGDEALSENTVGNISALEAVMMLPPKMRDAVYLYYYEDMSIKEIAASTGRNPATVGSDLRRARQKLSEILKEEI